MAHTARQEQIPRRYDLDWLRVLVILFVFVFHVGLIFSSRPWLVQNDEVSLNLFRLLDFSAALRMPVLFFIAGAGTWFLLRRRTSTIFLRDRFLRLGVPLLVGILLLIPFEAYYARQFETGANLSYLAVWRDFLSGAVLSVHNHWSHLWFVAYLLVFSVVATPLFRYLRTPGGEAFGEGLLRYCRGPFGLLAFAAPLILIRWGLTWRWPGDINLINDLTQVLTFFVLFVYGYVLFGSAVFWNTVDRNKTWALLAGFLCLGLWIGLRPILGPHSDTGMFEASYIARVILLSLYGWLCLVGVLGYVRHFLSFENALLRYMRDASYPIYVLHHPIIVAVGFYVVQMSIHPVIKAVMILVISFMLTIAVYDLAIRRWPIVRLAFGLKANTGSSAWAPIGRFSQRSLAWAFRVGPRRIL